ncbi:MAG TPA: hypothetical protein VIV54_13420, partial [Burkholderiales bacterium]
RRASVQDAKPAAESAAAPAAAPAVAAETAGTAAAAAAPTPSARAAPPEKPEPWLERIAELRSRGRHAEADRQLAEFRRAYPSYVLSEIMRERVEGR